MPTSPLYWIRSLLRRVQRQSNRCCSNHLSPTIRRRRHRVAAETLEERCLLTSIELAGLTADQGTIYYGGVKEDTIPSDDEIIADDNISIAGDINGDGFDDVVIGAQRADGHHPRLPFDTGHDRGEIYIFFGGIAKPGVVDLFSEPADVVIYGDSDRSHAGTAVSAAADVNGDGFDDILIGAPLEGGQPCVGIPDCTNGQAGSAYVVFGGPTLPATIELASLGSDGVKLNGNNAGDRTGGFLDAGGDVNGDGIDDFIVSAPGFLTNPATPGEAYLVYGRPEFPETIDIPATGFGVRLIGGLRQRLGAAVSFAGDVNADGFGDLLVGSPSGSENYLIYGKSDLPDSIDLTIDGNADVTFPSPSFPAISELSAAGDVNGDGFHDILIGVPYADGTGTDKNSAGQVFLVYGGSNLPSEVNVHTLGSAGIEITGADARDNVGGALADAGDVNGDGYDDVIFSSIYASRIAEPLTWVGESYVLFGGPALPQEIDLNSHSVDILTLYGIDDGYFSGVTLAGGGDFDGDGYDDLLIHSLSDSLSSARINAGETYLIFGRDFLGTTTHPGSSDDDVSTGGPEADALIGGLGNDHLVGGGGADVLMGAAGNDILTVSDGAFLQVDGGHGTDTLKIDGFPGTLNLQSEAGSRIRNIELIDVRGVNNDSLWITPLSVLNLSDQSNTLTIRRDAGDSVGVPFDWTFSARANESGVAYNVYTSGNATIRIEAVNSGFVTGTAWEDNNKNGLFDDGELPRSGVAIYLDLNENGVRDPTEPRRFTDSGGTYNFTHVVFGEYSVREDAPAHTITFPQTADKLLAGQPGGFAVIDSDGTYQDIDGWDLSGSNGIAIGRKYVFTADSHGRIHRYDRKTGDRIDLTFIRVSSEINDIAVGPDDNLYVSHSEGLDTFDVESGGLLRELSNAQNLKGIEFARNGRLYVIHQTLNAVLEMDYVSGRFIGVAVADGLDAPVDVQIDNTGHIYVLSQGTNNVLRFDSSNGNLIDEPIAPQEEALSKFVLGPRRDLFATTGTDVFDGDIRQFSGESGELIRIIDPGRGAHSIEFIGNTPAHQIRVTDTSSVTLNFGAVTRSPVGSISGFKWRDENGDSVFDDGEDPIEGATVFLDSNDNGLLDAGEVSTVTDSTGRYEFASQTPGDYIVRDQVAEGSERTFPNGSGVELLVSDTSRGILAFSQSGLFRGNAAFTAPHRGGLTLGPDGLLYASSFGGDSVSQYDPKSGQQLRVFADADELDGATGIAFGPDGNLYVSSYHTNSIVRFDGESGEFIDVFASGGDLLVPLTLTFGADGQLYVLSNWNTTGSGAVMKDDSSGNATTLVQGSSLEDFAIGPDGDLYTLAEDVVWRYDGKTGNPKGAFASGGPESWTSANMWVAAEDGQLLSTYNPADISFAPNGDLYMSVYVQNGQLPGAILRFDGITGKYIDFGTQGTDFSRPWTMDFVGDPDTHFVTLRFGDEVSNLNFGERSLPSISLTPVFDELPDGLVTDSPVKVAEIDTTAATGDLEAYESFDYPDGNRLLGANGGFGFSGSWNIYRDNAVANDYTVVAEETSYPGLQQRRGRATTGTQTLLGGLRRELSTPLGQDNTTRYFSILMEPKATLGDGAFGGFMTLTLDSRSGPDVDIAGGGNSESGTGPWRVENLGGTGAFTSSVAPVVDEPTLLVLKAEFLPGNDRFTLYVDPAAGDFTEPMSGVVKDDVDVDIIEYVTLYSTGAVAYDELRVGTTYASVVPAHYFSLSGDDASLFHIDGDSLQLNGSVTLDQATNPLLDVTVSVEDPALTGMPDASASLSIPVDSAALSASINVASISESPGLNSAVLTITRNTTTTGSRSVFLRSLDISEINVPDEVTIPAGESSVSIELVVLDDDLNDGDQTVIVEATASGHRSATASVVVTDNDAPPLVTLTSDLDTIIEAGAPATITASLSEVSFNDVSIQLNPGGTDPDDYQISNPVITIPAGQLAGNVTLSAIDDSVYDPFEVVTIGIGAVSNAEASGEDDLIIAITDETPPTLSLDVNTSLISEDGGVATFTVTLSHVSDHDVFTAPNFTQTDDFGRARFGVDFTSSDSLVHIPAGDLSVHFTVTALDDNVNEIREVAHVRIDDVLGAAGSAIRSFQIEDNDASPSVSLRTSTAEIDEAAGTAEVTAELSHPTYQDVVIGLSTHGADSDDYSLEATTITIPAGQLSANIEISAVQDQIDEDDEVITLSIDQVTNGIEAGEQSVDVTIIDDDALPEVAITSTETTLSEGSATTIVTATLSELSGRDVIVNLNLDGSAVNNVDFSITATTITIPAGNVVGSVVLTTLQDNLDEDDEVVTVSIDHVTNGGESGEQTVDVSIIDDDALPAVALFSDDTVLTEAAMATTVTVALAQVSGRDVVVDLNLSGSAVVDADFSAGSTTITIPAGDVSGSVVLTTLQDNLDEDDEVVTVSIDHVTNGGESGEQSVDISIIDDDPLPTVALFAAATVLAESSEATTVTAALSAVSGRDVMVTLDFSGTAVVDGDFSIGSTTITIPAGDVSGSIVLATLQDNLDEDDEVVTVSIDQVTNGIESGEQAVDFSIIDDDALPEVALFSDDTVLTEAAMATTVTVALAQVSGRDVIVDLNVDGSAVNNVDFSITATTITIPAGNVVGSVVLTTLQDPIDEDDEVVTVSIDQVTNGIESGEQSVDISIIDDDPLPTVVITAANAVLAEDSATTTVTATLSEVSGRDVIVDLNVDGSAVNNVDFSITATTITIPAGNVAGSVVLTAIQDQIDEDNETVVLNIASTINATDNGTNQTTLTIFDDDPLPFVTLTMDEDTISENNGIATISAALSEVSGRDVTVELLLGGTATHDDRHASAESIVIPAGSLSASVVLTTTNDTIDEADEVVTVAVGQLTNGIEDDEQAVEVIIIDDDGTVDLTGASFDALSDRLTDHQTDVTFTVRNSGTDSSGDFEIVIFASGNSIIGDADDFPVPGTRRLISSLPMGETSSSQTVNVQLDAEWLFQQARMAYPVGRPVGSTAAEVSRLYLVIDDTNLIAESDENNNVGRVHQIDSDDVTAFPWDVDANNVVSPREALSTIVAIDSADPMFDFDRNGIVTPLEALGVVQRIGYRALERVVEVPEASLLQQKFEPAGVATPSNAFVIEEKRAHDLFDLPNEEAILQHLDNPEPGQTSLDDAFTTEVQWLDVI